MAAKADDLEALRTAVIDAAGVSFGLWISYLFVLFYLLVAAGGVTHRDLFFESPVKLPFLNVDLPLKGFFWLGPALFLVMHAYVLLHFVMLAGKVGVFDAQLRAQIEDPEVRTRLRRQLPSNIFVQFLAGPRELRDGIMGLLLWLIALISLVVGPVALLVFFQLQFLPYHDVWITWWQRITVVVDLALLWTLWPRVGLLEEVSTGEGEMRRRGVVEVTQRIGTIVGMLLISVISVALVFAIATFPSEWLDEEVQKLPLIAPLRTALVKGQVDTNARKPESLWSNTLVLPGLDVIDHTKLDETKIAALPETASLRARHLEGAVLIGAGLRKVDFTAARLDGARLVEADLRAAKLDFAQLQGGQLDSAQLQGASLRVAQLRGAVLNGAYLQGVSLDNAQLQGAALYDAHLLGASLESAHLQGASLSGAYLQGASLHDAELQGAALIDVELQVASLDFANLQGAVVRAQLQGASLDHAELQGATLDVFVWRADARTADATDARIFANTGRKQAQHGLGSKVVDWSAASLTSLKDRIKQEVPEGISRTNALARVGTRPNPETPLEQEDQMAEHWAAELQHSPAPDAYEAKLAEVWRKIGCSGDDAPYVLAGLIRQMTDIQFSPFSQDSLRVRQLAADFLKDDCAGARGLSDDAKGRLKALRDRVAQKPADPGVQRSRDVK